MSAFDDRVDRHPRGQYLGRGFAGYGTPQTPDDLDRHGCLAYEAQVISETWELTSQGRTRKARTGQSLAANDGEFVARLAENGEGIALLPFFIVEDVLATGALKQILDGWEAPQLWLTLYYPSMNGYRSGLPSSRISSKATLPR
ncbi:LysR substrate-binding domain-containing protein [Ensifer adhaerens]|uniref:LysR substrate-binding domain-containing protein n=1 Tax=Ensifer adhaerens TaxID=106592 RepID=UPI001CBFC2A8|nr:LysR substrate-binding domain-containing protein [Ensifer adhaerens]MBZ7925105.1 hypothetical protein [Ensifer adhaerens]